MKRTILIAPVLASFVAQGSLAQSLFLQPVATPVTPAGDPDPAAPLRAVSMIAVAPPKPRTFAIHDLITIIVDEASRSSSDQSLSSEKQYQTGIGVNAVIDPIELLNLRLRQGSLRSQTLLDADADREYEGEGTYERQDRFTARITAQVIDVKPNGTLVIEARKQIVRDSEISTLVLTGMCRQEDVTLSNTILSSQLANLFVAQNNEGEVRKSATKGLIPTVLDTLFSF